MSFPFSSQQFIDNNTKNTNTSDNDSNQLPVIITSLIIFVIIVYIILIVFLLKHFLKRSLLKEKNYHEYCKKLKKITKKKIKSSKYTFLNDESKPEHMNDVIRSTQNSNLNESVNKKYPAQHVVLQIHNSNEKFNKKKTKYTNNSIVTSLDSNKLSNNISISKKKQHSNIKSNHDQYRQFHDREQLLYSV